MVDDLTLRERRFIDAYIRTGVGSKAAIEAGYSEKSAKTTANRKMSDPRIKEALDEARSRAAEILGIDAAWVLRHAVNIVETCSRKMPVNDMAGKQKEDEHGNPVYRMVDAPTARATLKDISEWAGMNREKKEKEEDSTTGVLQVQAVSSEEAWTNG